MKWPDCQFNNPEGMNFCGKCGRVLSISCPECGHENPPDFELCDLCGNVLARGIELPDYARRSLEMAMGLANEIGAVLLVERIEQAIEDKTLRIKKSEMG